jgi:hypothetical protein
MPSSSRLQTTSYLSAAVSPSGLVVSLIGFVALVATGCGEETDPTSAEGAYLDARKALVEGDGARLWARCDDRTHRYFKRRYETLVQMDETIEQYLPQTDRDLARRQAGTELLDSVEGPKALFERIVRPQKLVVDQPRRLGLNIEKIQLSQDQSAAVVVTRAGQKFHLVKGDDAHWYVDLVESVPALRERLAWIEENRTALEKTVDKRIAEERERREAVISELMGVETPRDENP